MINWKKKSWYKTIMLLLLPLPLLSFGFYLNFGIEFVWPSFVIVGLATIVYLGYYTRAVLKGE